MNGISDVNPFVGPRPIQVGEALYGRKTEVRELFEQLQARRIVVLHSPSGAGKSSLVHAGLIPRLKAGKFFDVWKPIRVNLDPTSFEGLPEGTNRYLLSAMVSLEEELPAKHRRSPVELAKLDFLDYLESRPRRKSRTDHSVVLLFDQFEEVLSVAPRAVDAKEEFFATVGKALDTDKYWALFIIREDYLAALAPYRDLIPTQMFNTYRLDLLGLAGAREAAVRLAEEGGRSFPAVDKLVRDLSMVQVQQTDGTFVAEQGLHVEPVYLQVVCRRLWDAMPADELVIDEQHTEAYADISASLGAYYADAVRAIADGDAATERSVRDWVGNKLIVGGIRSQVRQERGASGGLDNRCVEQLLDSYLVRSEQRAGANWFELSHDRLVEPIQQDNEIWQRGHLHPLQVQAKLWEDGGRDRPLLYGAEALPSALKWAQDNAGQVTEGEQEFLESSQSLHREQMQRRQRERRFVQVLGAVAVLAMTMAGFALFMKGEADTAQKDAEAQKGEAEAAQKDAEAQKGEAEDATTLAKDATKLAKDAQKDAEDAQKDAEKALQQVFEVSLRPFIEHVEDLEVDTGTVEVTNDANWTLLLLGPKEQPVVAASMGEHGRIVVAGHRSVLEVVAKSGYSLFLEITANWLLKETEQRGVVIITHRSDTQTLTLETNLKHLKYNPKFLTKVPDLDQLSDVGMLIIDDRSTTFSDGEVKTVQGFIKGGGGMLAVGHGHEWLESKGGEQAANLADYPMNRLLESFGIHWTNMVIDPKYFESDELVLVRFENESSGVIEVFKLLSPEGREQKLFQLPAGSTKESHQDPGTTWIFRDARNQKIPEKKIAQTTTDDDKIIWEIGKTKRKLNDRVKDKVTRQCRGKWTKFSPATIEIKFEVGANGKVMSAKALENESTGPAKCLVGALNSQTVSTEGIPRSWTFANPS